MRLSRKAFDYRLHFRPASPRTDKVAFGKPSPFPSLVEILELNQIDIELSERQDRPLAENIKLRRCTRLSLSRELELLRAENYDPKLIPALKELTRNIPDRRRRAGAIHHRRAAVTRL
jgi:hypothetical protein